MNVFEKLSIPFPPNKIRWRIGRKSKDKDKYTGRDKKGNLDTKDKLTEKADHIIVVLFVTITTLIWSILGYAFSDNSIIKAENDSPLILNIRWLLNQPYQIIHNLDLLWHFFVDRIKTTPLIKSFSAFCVSFIVIFFGAFIRIPYSRNIRKYSPMDRFDIINIEHTFTGVFDRNIDDYRCLSLFVLCLLVCMGFSSILYFYRFFFDPKVSKNILFGVLSVFSIILFSSMFAKREDLFPDSYSVKKLVFFLLCIIFASVGTPVVLGLLQLLTEAGLLTMIQKCWLWLYCTFSSTSECVSTSLTTLNYKGVLEILGSLIFIVLLFTLYGLGVDKDWIGNDSGKNMRMFNAVLITMSVSLFIALSTHYNMGTALYTFIKRIMEFVIVYLAPITVVILSIVKIIYAQQVHSRYKIFSKK